MLKPTRFVPLALLALLLFPAFALGADVPRPQAPLAFPTTQVWVFAVGALVPSVTYVLNHYAPWVDERIKGVVFVVVAAIAGALTQAINAGGVGFNQSTFQLVVTAVLGAVAGHFGFWKPSLISATLGGGRNHQAE